MELLSLQRLWDDALQREEAYLATLPEDARLIPVPHIGIFTPDPTYDAVATALQTAGAHALAHHVAELTPRSDWREGIQRRLAQPPQEESASPQQLTLEEDIPAFHAPSILELTVPYTETLRQTIQRLRQYEQDLGNAGAMPLRRLHQELLAGYASVLPLQGEAYRKQEQIEQAIPCWEELLQLSLAADNTRVQLQAIAKATEGLILAGQLDRLCPFLQRREFGTTRTRHALHFAAKTGQGAEYLKLLPWAATARFHLVLEYLANLPTLFPQHAPTLLELIQTALKDFHRLVESQSYRNFWVID